MSNILHTKYLVCQTFVVPDDFDYRKKIGERILIKPKKNLGKKCQDILFYFDTNFMMLFN